MKPHQQTEWYAILRDDEKLKVDEYTEKWPISRTLTEINTPFNSFLWSDTPEKYMYWFNEVHRISLIINAKKQLEKLEGKPSPSMGVNTKPADRIEYKGRLIYFEYETPNEIIEEVKLKLK